MAYSSGDYKDEEELKREFSEQFLLAKKFLDPIHGRMIKQEELYRTFIDQGSYPHGAMVFDPRIFRVIETITPRMVANEPLGSFYPQEEGDVVTSEILNALIKYDWRKAGMFEKLVKFVKSMLIFGTAFGRTHWDFREETRRRMVPKEINGRMVWAPSETEEVDIVTFDGPNFEVLNIYDCFFDPNATNLEEMRWFIFRSFKTFRELKDENNSRDSEYYKNLDKLEAMVKSKDDKNVAGGGVTEDLTYRQHRRTMLGTEEFIGKDSSNPDIVVLTRWTKDGWCTMLPEFGNLIIRETENPRFDNDLPVVYGVDYPYPNELLGMGEIEPIDRIQRAINAVLNQRLDNVQLTLRHMWKVRKNSGVDLHTLVSAPGNIVTTDDMAAIEALQVPDVTGATFIDTMNYLTSALQNGSGITDYTIGIDNKSNVANKTATGTRLIQQEANAQFKLKIQLFNHMVIQRIANHWKDLRIQYTTEEQKLRILGKEEVSYMKENTELSKTDMFGEEIFPGETDRAAKLEVSSDGEFAFLNLLPDDIQPNMVGNYDFIATVSSENLTDPIALQENFFSALEQVKDGSWTRGLATQGKQLNYVGLTEKVFDKLNLGLDMKDVVVGLENQDGQQQQEPQVMTHEDIQGMAGDRPVDPLSLDQEEYGEQSR